MDRSVKRASRRLLPGVVLVIAGLAAAPAVFATVGVNIAGFAFAPASTTVKVGDTVTWTNSDAVGHTATADDGSFDTGTIGAGSTSNGVTFNTAGTFAYHCTIHSAMHGTVVVSASTTPPPTDTFDPAAPFTDGAPGALLMLAAIGGLAIGRRRFGRVAKATAPD